jgi:tetratricopeptide (TPR) repeat protein
MTQAPKKRSHSKPWKTACVLSLIVLGTLILTAWNLTRSTALVEARHAYARGDLAHCLQFALDHLERQPWSREAALWAARCLSRLDYTELAEPYFHRAGHLALNDLQIRAYGLARGPHPECAIPAYHEILARWPDNVTALRRLAAVQLAEKNADALLDLADRLSRISRGAITGETLRGVVYHNDSNPQRAVACFQRVLEMDPELHEMPLSRRLFWSHLGDDLVASGHVDDAGRALTKALVNNPDAVLMNRLGRVYLLQGAFADAEGCFEQATQWDPGDYNSYLNLSKLALQRHQPTEAVKHLTHARVLAPNDIAVLYSLASVYRQLGRSADAARVQETITQLRDNMTGHSRPPNARWRRYAL